MKSLRRRIRDWLNDDDDSMVKPSPRAHNASHLDSQGFRLQVYKASGGIVIETHAYDEKKAKGTAEFHYDIINGTNIMFADYVELKIKDLI